MLNAEAHSALPLFHAGEYEPEPEPEAPEPAINQVALLRRLSDVVAEYDEKVAALPKAFADFEQRGKDLMTACTIGGTFGRERIDTGSVYDRTLAKNLLVSAWVNVYEGLKIEKVASAKDKALFSQSLASPPDFTLQNIKTAFGAYLLDPRGNILRGLAEMFADLDPAYKSHEKVKIGVAGLPKRIILGNVGGYGWGRDRLQNTLNALAVVMGRPMIGYHETSDLLKNGEGLKNSHDIWLKTFANGNGHLFFGPVALREINLALAEYYGDVLADTRDGEEERRPGTAVSKDLQYYPTPEAVVEKVLDQLYLKDELVLEPSCGCGRFLDGLVKAGARVYGIECDPERAAIAKSKGHAVHVGNFLETAPQAKFDKVVMNPPFYGKHYAKHIEHALKFLKEGGSLTAILPVTARYDHGLLDHHRPRWVDLPVGSFTESGTNINTTVVTIFK